MDLMLTIMIRSLTPFDSMRKFALANRRYKEIDKSIPL
jgi:hypothetical protein